MLFATRTFVWGLQGMCNLQRIPIAPNLVLQQVPPPYNLDSLQQAAQALGLKTGVKRVPAAHLADVSLPCLAVLKPGPMAPKIPLADSASAAPGDGDKVPPDTDGGAAPCLHVTVGGQFFASGARCRRAQDDGRLQNAHSHSGQHASPRPQKESGADQNEKG